MGKSIIKAIASVITVVLCSAYLFSADLVYAANSQILRNLSVRVDGGEEVTVKAIDHNYNNNRYISLRDMAAVLKGTKKAFDISCGNDEIVIKKSDSYEIKDGDLSGFSDEKLADFYRDMTFKRPKMSIDGREVKYYCVISSVAENGLDCYMNMADFAMVFDVNLNRDGLSLDIKTSDSYAISMSSVEESGYLDAFRGVAVGDATTGEIYYSFRGNEQTAIASTTKLMTYSLIMDSIKQGKYDMGTVITTDRDVEELSKSADGTIEMNTGSSATVEEMLRAMLVASSNEAALALALNDAGSEEAFAEKMNNKAKSLGLNNTIFRNCHGLPVFTEDGVPAKVQNKMTAEEMFLLASNIVNTYPEIHDITSLKETVIKPYAAEIKNTNQLLYNLSSVNGLKTGSTNLAGACLVSSMEVETSGIKHTIIAVEFGAEGSEDQYRCSELLIRYGEQQFKARFGESDPSVVIEVPTSAEGVANRVLQYLRSKN